MVQHAARAELGRRLAAAGAIATALVLALGSTGCGGDDEGGDPALGQGGPTIGVPIQLASCDDWEAATVEERLGTIAQIENYAGGPVGTGELQGATLDPDEAYDVIENFCGPEYARAFRLYKLYTRAAAFSGQ